MKAFFTGCLLLCMSLFLFASCTGGDEGKFMPDNDRV